MGELKGTHKPQTQNPEPGGGGPRNGFVFPRKRLKRSLCIPFGGPCLANNGASGEQRSMQRCAMISDTPYTCALQRQKSRAVEFDLAESAWQSLSAIPASST